ncbi:MAG: hypothetical protein M0R33_18905 [Methylomonas sp.]|jgi:hypothetical protein|uniref:hypothetical protein n=1 Tax=Methylomonas sp. TaxID=418 RepID=UPI0025E10792|nr:hypothetical protein [Methylomonas sp.]MCK9608515.1 hypothetical protein [Methylomonas sp.]
MEPKITTRVLSLKMPPSWQYVVYHFRSNFDEKPSDMPMETFVNSELPEFGGAVECFVHSHFQSADGVHIEPQYEQNGTFRKIVNALASRGEFRCDRQTICLKFPRQTSIANSIRGIGRSGINTQLANISIITIKEFDEISVLILNDEDTMRGCISSHVETCCEYRLNNVSPKTVWCQV